MKAAYIGGQNLIFVKYQISVHVNVYCARSGDRDIQQATFTVYDWMQTASANSQNMVW